MILMLFVFGFAISNLMVFYHSYCFFLLLLLRLEYQDKAPCLPSSNYKENCRDSIAHIRRKIEWIPFFYIA